MATGDDVRLAIFGGTPVRPGGPLPRQPNRPEIQAALEKAYRDGDWHRYHGECTRSLCNALAAYHGVEHVELCCSGTSALEIALRGLNVKAGDEVLVSGYDFKGIVSSVLITGAVPMVVDLDLSTLSPSVEGLADAASERTRAVVVSHLHGQAAPMGSIMEWARSKGIAVVEDACQSPGGGVGHRRAGTWGDVGVLSFGGSKLLTAGRGGALLTANAQIAQRMRLFCERGNDAFPLSELQAAVLLPQLERLDDENGRRGEAVARLALRIEPTLGIIPTIHRQKGFPTMGFYKLVLLLLGDQWNSVSREAAAAGFRAEGVAIDEGFKAVPDLFTKSRYRTIGDLAGSIFCASRMLVLHHPALNADEAELALVVRAIRKVAVAAARGDLDRFPSP
jgi:perosamine synthetase